jgi:hypothetical protein
VCVGHYAAHNTRNVQKLSVIAAVAVHLQRDRVATRIQQAKVRNILEACILKDDNSASIIASLTDPHAPAAHLREVQLPASFLQPFLEKRQATAFACPCCQDVYVLAACNHNQQIT